MTIEGGRRVGRYELRRKLGSGHRKSVYLAHDDLLNRDVAVALYDQSASTDDRLAVEREARIMARLGDHPNMVTVYDTGVADGVPFIVSEFMPGGDLLAHCRSLAASGAQLSMGEILRLADEISQSLAHAHRHGVIHCDVAPANVWLDADRHARLGDFDSALVEGDVASPEETDTTTTRYQSPERQAGESVDARTDVYSLGVLLHELIAGCLPQDTARSIGEWRPDTPASVASLITRMIEADPKDRPATAMAVQGVLAGVRAATQTLDVDGLIAGGESSTVEFKDSLRFTREAVPAGVSAAELRRSRERASIKTVAGFLNTSGGTLLIGVADDGTVCGIEDDFPLVKTPSQDGWELTFRDLVKRDLGADTLACVGTRFQKTEKGTVAIITVSRRSQPTWMLHPQTKRHEIFYARLGNRTDEFRGPDLVSYIAEHFGS